MAVILRGHSPSDPPEMQALRQVARCAASASAPAFAPQHAGAAAAVCCREFHASAPVERFRKYGRGMRYKLPLSSKRSNRRFYKGKGSTTEGRHTRKGGYIIDPDKILTLSVPDLTGCEVSAALPRPSTGAAAGFVFSTCIRSSSTRCTRSEPRLRARALPSRRLSHEGLAAHPLPPPARRCPRRCTAQALRVEVHAQDCQRGGERQ